VWRRPPALTHTRLGKSSKAFYGVITRSFIEQSGGGENPPLTRSEVRVSTTPHAGSSRAPKSIGLWGAPSSGKTTFLASLFIAVNRRPQKDMNIFGVDDASTNFLIDSTRTMTRDYKFPPATQAAVSYSWTLNMDSLVERTEAGRFGRKTTTSEVRRSQFNIDLRDAPGGYFGNQPAQAPQLQRINLGGGSPATAAAPAASAETEMMDYLSGCDGLLLLIDPVREQEFGDAHDYFQTTLLKIAQRKLAAPGAAPRLPHHVAVCITKFDHPDVYRFAKVNKYHAYEEEDPYLFPRVHESDAEGFFREFCRTSPRSEAELICSALSSYFERDQIRFFVSSAIGLHLGDSARFRDNGSPQNTEDVNGVPAIRGRVYPINVLEPILWLGQRVLAG
jgi:hypothetical protein